MPIRALVICAVLSGFIVTGQSRADLITDGFNDYSGIDANPSNPPYVFNTSIYNQGGGSAGWSTPWGGNGYLANVINTNTYEGDGALELAGNTQAYRSLTVPISGITNINIYVQISTVAGLAPFSIYTDQTNITNPYLRIATHAYANPNGYWYVGNGLGNGNENFIDTNMMWTPGSYQDIQIQINTYSQTWSFSVNGMLFNYAPLDFRGDPSYVDQLSFLSTSSTPIYIDDISVNTDVPEPSSLCLFGLTAMLGITLLHLPRHKKAECLSPI